MGDTVAKMLPALGTAGGAALGGLALPGIGAGPGAAAGGSLGSSLGSTLAPNPTAPTLPQVMPPGINRASLGSLPPPNISPVASNASQIGSGGGQASFADLLKLITQMKNG